MSNLLGSRLLGSLIVFQTQHIRYNLSMFINLLILFTERENTNYNEEEWRRKHFSIQLKLSRFSIVFFRSHNPSLFIAEIARETRLPIFSKKWLPPPSTKSSATMFNISAGLLVAIFLHSPCSMQPCWTWLAAINWVHT